MKQSNRWTVIISMIFFALFLAACQQATAESEKEQPAVVEPIAGTEFNRVTLTELAAKRLGIETDTVHEENVNGASAMVVPYAAILYGLNGETWVYMVSGERVYERTPITIERISGQWAILGDGPPMGTEVVTIGVAELYGADTGVGK